MDYIGYGKKISGGYMIVRMLPQVRALISTDELAYIESTSIRNSTITFVHNGKRYSLTMIGGYDSHKNKVTYNVSLYQEDKEVYQISEFWYLFPSLMFGLLMFNRTAIDLWFSREVAPFIKRNLMDEVK